MRRARAILLVGTAMAFLSPVAARALIAPNQYYYEALLDTDNNPSTGGPVTVVQGDETPHSIPGIDYIVRAYVGAPIGDSIGAPLTTAEVIGREVFKWNGTDFESIDFDNDTYPVGFDGSTAMVEFGAPWADIGAPTGTVHAVFHATQTAEPCSDYTQAFDFSLRAAPAASLAGLLALALLLLAAGGFALAKRRGNLIVLALAVVLAAAPVVWAAGIVLDGNFDDWAGISPVVIDAPNDSSNSDPAEDILAGYVAVQGTDVFFRVDLAGLPSAN